MDPNYLLPWIVLQWTIISYVPVLVSFAAIVNKAKQDTQWLITTKVPFLSMPRVVAGGNRLPRIPCVFFPGSRTKEQPFFRTSPTAARGKRARELEETSNSIWNVCSNWHTSLPLLFHWSKQVMRPNLTLGQRKQPPTIRHWKSYGDEWRCVVFFLGKRGK